MKNQLMFISAIFSYVYYFFTSILLTSNSAYCHRFSFLFSLKSIKKNSVLERTLCNLKLRVSAAQRKYYSYNSS